MCADHCVCADNDNSSVSMLSDSDSEFDEDLLSEFAESFVEEARLRRTFRSGLLISLSVLLHSEMHLSLTLCLMHRIQVYLKHLLVTAPQRECMAFYAYHYQYC